MYDIAIIGAGPGGYVAALKAAQAGVSVALIEKDEAGGTCLNRGCIPTKAMLASVHLWQQIQEAKSFGIEVKEAVASLSDIVDRQQKVVMKARKGLEQLLKSYSNIDLHKGIAGFKDAQTLIIRGAEEKLVSVKNIIIATGSEVSSLGPIVPDHQYILDSDDALSLRELPERLIVIGGGAIGVEWARIYSALGTQVTIIEMMDRLLPTVDKDLSLALTRLFKRNRVKMLVNSRVENIDVSGNKVTVTLDNAESLEAEKVLLAVGRKPCTDIDGLAEIGVNLRGRFIEADEYMCTNIPNIYAVGDVTGRLQLAHVASHEAIVAVEKILGQNPAPLNYAAVPFCIYGSPEIASIGFSEELAKADGLEVEVNKAFYAGNGKAISESEVEGFVKTVINKETQKIIGVHIIGAGASDIIHQGAIAVQKGLTRADFEHIVFAHPTLSESFHESIINLHTPGKIRKGI